MLPISTEKLIQKRLERFPQFYDTDPKIYMRILAHAEETFCEKRSALHLTRVIGLCQYLTKPTLHKIGLGSGRSLFLKCFNARVEEKNVLCIAFSVNLLHTHEVLDEKHILRALTHHLPGIKIVSASFFSYLEKSSSLLFCYLEIEKLRGNPLALREIALLRKKLPSELKQSIQSLTPSLFIPYNEEEVYKNLVQLAKELKSADDLPQVMISFQAQLQQMLRFTVILVRIKKKNSPCLKNFDALIPSSIHIASKRSTSVGFLPKKIEKEAFIFSLDIDHQLFLRKNWSIDLGKARNFIVTALEQALGQFRDYNGGLLSQQNKQIDPIKKTLKNKYENLHFIIDDFFYTIDPPIVQALISAAIGKQIFGFFVQLLDKKLPASGVLIERKKYKNCRVLILKTATLKCRDDLLKEVKKNHEPSNSCFGYNSVEFEGMYYLCLIDLALSNKDLIEDLEKILRKRTSIQKEIERNTLSINFQEGDPTSVNPHITTDMCGRSLGKALFEGLTRLNPKGIPELAAAQKVKISSCQTIYTFTLREHCWSNGEIVTAYDFEHAWKKALTSNSDCLRLDLFYPIKNAKKVKQKLLSVDEVKIKGINDKTLIVELEHPSSYFLHLMSHPVFSPLYRGEEEPTHFNGPFIVKEWKRDCLLHLTANPFYWDTKNVHLQDIFISMVRNIQIVSEMFERKELDWIGDPFSVLPSRDIPFCKGEYQVKRQKVDRIYWIHLNTLSFPLQSANIRKALAFSINRKQLCTELFRDNLPQYSPILDSKNKKNLFSEGNVALAQQYFEEGLKELNLTRETFPEITFHYNDFPGNNKLIVAIRNQIESVLKINFKLVELDWNNFSNVLERKEHQLAGYFLSSPYFYPYSHLELFRDPSHLCNASQWVNQEYLLLLDLAQQTVDQKTRSILFKRAEQILLEEIPVIPLFRPNYKCLLNHRIKRAFVAKNGDVDLKLVLLKNRI